MKKFLNVLGIIILGLVTAIIIGAFVWRDDVNIKNVIQDSDIKIVAEKCINVESMAKSNDNSIDIIKEKMATKEDINATYDKIDKRFERLENILIYQHIENKKLIANEF